MSQDHDITTVFDSTDAVENYQYLIYVARDEFLDENPELVEMWLEDYWEALQWWSDPDNREDMLDIAVDVMEMDHDVADAIVQTENDYYHGENGLSPDIEGLETPIEAMVDFGFLDEMVDVESYVDDSYLPEDAQITY